MAEQGSSVPGVASSVDGRGDPCLPDEGRREPPPRSMAASQLLGSGTVGHGVVRISSWRHRNDEVGFVVRSPRGRWAIEGKSGRPGRPPGLGAFLFAHREACPLLIGSGGLGLEEFLCGNPAELFSWRPARPS